MLGLRMSVFEDLPPVAVYAPASVQIDIHAHTDADVALCSAPDVVKNLPARLITGQCIRSNPVRGQGSSTRYVTDVLSLTKLNLHKALVVEVKTPAGHSSSYPPHKHDRAAVHYYLILINTYQNFAIGSNLLLS